MYKHIVESETNWNIVQRELVALFWVCNVKLSLTSSLWNQIYQTQKESELIFCIFVRIDGRRYTLQLIELFI
uniref:Structural molecule n=1 Tax=Solanum tuberosum TaxID=4113 RepID=M1AKG2_SOLTU